VVDSGPRGTYGQTRYALSARNNPFSTWQISGGDKGLHFYEHWVMLKLSITSNHIACIHAGQVVHMFNKGGDRQLWQLAIGCRLSIPFLEALTRCLITKLSF
jgi:hypothetical protein